MERDQQAYDLFRQGQSYRQIARRLEYASSSSVHDAVRRAVRENAADPIVTAEAQGIILERLQDYRRLAWQVATATHYVTTQSGKLVEGPDGGYLIDDSPVLSALDRMLRCDQEEARLRDLYPPSRTRIEVVDDDVARALADEAEREIARITEGAADPGHRVTGERPQAR